MSGGHGSRPPLRVTGGRVFLVGAGPGDPGLITVRGVELLGRAEVVLYDELTSAELLLLAPDGALLINVGKRGHAHPTRTQDEINALLVEHALAGKRVVRLKGGDPFVFGRGGEEASACVEAGIPFEVVPGVSSAVAALAYAGIPVTDRRHAASFAVVTGHKDPTRAARQTRWHELASAVDTLVILMGMRNLPELVERMIESGKAPETPAAAVMDGTLPEQQVVVSTLAALPRRVADAGLGAPAAVVVGDVVSLRDQLAWRETMPLHGMRVLVTRASLQSGELTSALRDAGATPVLMPLIELVAPSDRETLAEINAALDHLERYDALLFGSSNAVRFFADHARAAGVDAKFAKLGGHVLCIGAKTARAALDAGLPIHFVASGRGDAESMLREILQTMSPEGRQVLIPRSDIGRNVLPDGLREAGARVDTIQVYRNVRPAVDGAELCRDLVSESLPVLTFTSPSTVNHFSDLLDESARAAVSRCTIAAIGSTTARALHEAGFAPDVVPERPDVNELVHGLVAHVAALRQESREQEEQEEET